MGTIDRAVEAVPLIVAICLERLEQPQPLPPLRPPVKPVEHRFSTNRTHSADRATVRPYGATTRPPRRSCDRCFPGARLLAGTPTPLRSSPTAHLAVVHEPSYSDGTHARCNGNSVRYAQQIPPT